MKPMGISARQLAADIEALGRRAAIFAADLADPAALAALPDAPTVFFLAGVKFGTAADVARLQATNVELPRRVAARYAGARVVAFSSGNHAQAVALAGRLLGIPATIVMPSNAPAVKLEATRGYGAEVVTYDPKTQNREQIAAELATQRGLTVVPPFNHPHILAGQGTAAQELIEDTGPLDYLLVPCGGGGLISGCAIAANHLSPGIRVVGVEPAAGDDVTRSFKSGVLQSVQW